MRMKFSKNLRPQFRELLKQHGSLKSLAAFLGVSWQSVAMAKSRGYMGREMAYRAEVATGVKIKGLVKKGTVK